jgi:hypothetical protein
VIKQTRLKIDPVDNGMVRIHIKSFIQPFEYQLALLEIQKILGLESIPKPDKNGNVYEKIDKKQFALLRTKLAYSDVIEAAETATTVQTNLESSYMNGVRDSLPKRRILRYGPHGLHEYRGKFFPQMVKALVNISGAPAGAKVLDPMCGSGTTNVVAKEMGFKTLGFDMNPLSVELSKAKTDIIDLDPDEIEELQSRVLERLMTKEALQREHPRYEYLKGWFDERAINEIVHIIAVIEEEPKQVHQRFLKVALSNVIRDISWQKTADLRIRKEVYDYKPGQARELFAAMLKKNVANTAAYLGSLHRNKKSKYKAAHINTGDARNFLSDAPHLRENVDVIVTSPPYATALPYLDTDRLSLAVLNLLTTASHKDIDLLMIGNREINKRIKSELWDNYKSNKLLLTKAINDLIDTIDTGNNSDPTAGFRKLNLPPLLAKYFIDMRDVLSESLKASKKGANAFFIVGSNSTTVMGEKVMIDTDVLLWDLAKKVGWKQVQYIPMELLHSRDIFKENRGSTETILWLKK